MRDDMREMLKDALPKYSFEDHRIAAQHGVSRPLLKNYEERLKFQL